MKARRDNSKRFPKKNAAGKNQCQECGKETPPGMLPKWWHPECLEAYLVRSDPAHARKAAIERDKGVCGGCGVDTERLSAWLRSLPTAYGEQWLAHVVPADRASIGPAVRAFKDNGPMNPTQYAPRVDRVVYGRRDRHTYGTLHGALLGRHRGRAMVLLGRLWGVKLSWSSHLFEIDHIVPVAEGGGGCGLDNLRTLCRRCHRLESAALNARLRRRPTKGVGRGF